MTTLNGQRFLDEQLASAFSQSPDNIEVWVSDDGSSDGTLTILEAWRMKWNKGAFRLLEGPQKGFAENYRSLICNDEIQADYYAFCDQDDIWEQHKLSHALHWLRSGADAQPRLFCSRTATISEDGSTIGRSPLFKRPPSFRNALAQSIAGANTMVFNRSARDLLARASATADFVSHDWWAYLIVAGAGGEVHYSPEPLVRYRQHGGNSMGQNTSMVARLDRFKRLFEGQFLDWTSANMASLSNTRDLLTSDSLTALDHFIQARQSHLLPRLWHLYRSGVHRQTRTGTLALVVAALAGRF